MVADLRDTTGLCATVVRENVDVRDCCSDSEGDISVNGFDVVSIAEVETSRRIVNVEKRAGWIETDDCVDATSSNVLSSDPGDVS